MSLDRLGHRRVTATVMLLALLLGACTSGADTGPAVGSSLGFGDDGGEPAGDPRLEEIVFSCDGLRMPLDELLELDSLPEPTNQAFSIVARTFKIGQPERWAQLESLNLLDRTPLDTTPPALVIGMTDLGAHPCLAIRDADHRPVAWRIDEVDRDTNLLVAAIEPCVAVDQLVADIRVIGGDAVVSLFSATAVDPEAGSCVVDGSALVNLTLPEVFTGSVVSGQTWPFVAPELENWVAVERWNPQPVLAVEQVQLDDVTCTATGGLDGVGLEWWGVPPGVDVDIIGDDEFLTDAGRSIENRRLSEAIDEAFAERMVEYGNPPGPGSIDDDPFQAGDGPGRPDNVFSLFGAPPEPGIFYELRLRAGDLSTTVPCGQAGVLAALPVPDCSIELTGGKPQLLLTYSDGALTPINRVVYRDDERIEASFSGGPNPIDTTAQPGATHSYRIELSDNLSDRDPAVADCGSITIPQAPAGADELAAAEELFQRTSIGAHAYATLVIDGATGDYYLQPGGGIDSFVPPVAATDLVDPYTIHQELIAAMADERSVSYELDQASGLPTLWTVDGVTRKLLCFEVDTAPPDLRQGPCNPDLDLLNR